MFNIKIAILFRSSFEESRNAKTIDVGDAGFVKTLPLCNKEFSKRGRSQSRIAHPELDTGTVKHYNYTLFECTTTNP